MANKTVKYIKILPDQQLIERKRKIEGALLPVIVKRRRHLAEGNPLLNIKIARLNILAKNLEIDRLVAIFKMYLEN